MCPGGGSAACSAACPKPKEEKKDADKPAFQLTRPKCPVGWKGAPAKCSDGSTAMCSAACPKPKDQNNDDKKDEEKPTTKPGSLGNKCPPGLKAAPARCSDGSMAMCKAACPEKK